MVRNSHCVYAHLYFSRNPTCSTRNEFDYEHILTTLFGSQGWEPFILFYGETMELNNQEKEKSIFYKYDQLFVALGILLFNTVFAIAIIGGI